MNFVYGSIECCPVGGDLYLIVYGKGKDEGIALKMNLHITDYSGKIVTKPI